MTFTPENIFFLGAVLIFASIVISKWGYRFGIPTLLLFLFTGMLFGSDGLGLEFHSHEDAQLIGMLLLSVILFSGGMDTKFRDIQPVAAQGLVLSTLGVLVTTAITGMLIFYLSEWTNLAIGLTLPMSMLLAATVSSTDSASVFNLLRSQGIGLKHNLRPTLELESGSNDPMAFVLTIALVDMIVSAGEFSGMELASKIVGQLAVGGLRGAVPIIFATYPVIAGIEDAHFLFNVVFVITLLSLSIQGTTITACARWLGLATEEPKEGNEFGVELPEELGSRLSEMIVTDETLTGGNHLADMHFPRGTLVMMIKRGNSIIVPNGQLELKKGDILLTIAQQETE